MSEPGLEVGELTAVSPASAVARADANDPSAGDQKLARRRLGDERGAALIRALGEPGADLRDGGDVVPVVPHRRRSREPRRPLGGQVIEALALHPRAERHVLAVHPGEELPESPRVHDRAGEEVRAGRLPLLDDRHGDLPEPVAGGRALLEELVHPDRGGEAGWAASDHEDADVDSLVGRVGRLGDELCSVEGRREIGGPGAHEPLLSFTSSVSLGTISCTSPTTARSEYSKIGAFGSLLMATIVPDPCIPTLCWIAPEMPHAM